MIGVLDLEEIRYESNDLPDLQTLLKQLIGQPFRFFRFAYGDELRLHLGSPQSYINPRMQGRPRGTYVIGARASSWVVFSAPKLAVLASDDVEVPAPEDATRRVEIKRIEDGGYITPGSIVVGVTSERSPYALTLLLFFADGSTAFIGPNPETHEHMAVDKDSTEDHEEMEICDWEVLTPHSRVLKVGPDGRWCYLESNKKKS